MAKAAAAALLFLLLAVAFANDAAHLPPGDQDASGDDEDMFSGSGFEPSPDEKWVDVSNAEKPTDSNLTSVPTSAATENQHPVVMGTQSAVEMESATVPTTRAVETEIPIMGPKEELDQILVSEKNGTEESTAVFLAPTSLPTVQPYSVKITTLHVIDPVMHHVPQEATTAASTTQATDLVPHAHKDTTSTTEAIETTPTHHHHHHHHGHHHGHHHEVTTHSNPTEATEPHVHHVHHPATSTTSATSPIDPQVHHGHGRHVPHPDAPNATVIAVVPDLTTKDANLLEEDPINEETTTAASYHDDSQTNFPVVIAEGEPETERPDPADVEGSAETTEETDFFLEPVVHEGKAAGTVNAAEDEGISDTSTGFMEQKGVLAAVIAGGVAGLLFAICLVGFMLYRMKKKDEGSYCLEETKQTNGGYEKPIKQEEFYA